MENKRRGLKLYVWTGFCPDYTSGLAVALAKDETEARVLVKDAFGRGEPWEWGELEVHPINQTVAKYVCGGG